MKNYLINSIIIGILTISGFTTSIIAQESQQPTKRSIKKITGDIYRAQNNHHYTVFLVTDEGIIMSDPINKEFANWLKEELSKRFAKPVKYVLYSHYHWDHVSGGEVFKDTATFISHENMLANLAPPLTEPELANVRKPDVVYKDKLIVSLGGKTVEMHYTGKNHTDDMSVIYFPEEKTVFIVDFINAKQLPWRYMPGFYPDWIDSIKAVETIDFNTFIPGHGHVGIKQDVTDHRRYIEELMAAVKKGIKAGKSVEELQKTITMDAYKGWGRYDAWRAENVAGIYNILSKGEK